MIIKEQTKFDFDSAHRLVGYCGLCHQLHGHIWTVIIDIEGTEKDLDEVGILWDFTNVKKIKTIFDHKTILKNCDENLALIKEIKRTCGADAVFVMHDNPTAEHLAMLILQTLELENDKLKFKVKVYETPKSYAEVTSKL